MCGMAANKKKTRMSQVKHFHLTSRALGKPKVSLQMFDKPLLRRFAEEHPCRFLLFCLAVVY